MTTTRRLAALWVLGLLAALGVLAPAGPASAVQVPHPAMVSDDPVNWTPHVLDGRVLTVAQVGNTVYLGGQFSRVRSATSTTELTRHNFVAFDATTGEIRDLAPVFDGGVEAIIPAADGQSLYIGGAFRTVDGRASRGLVRLSTATGQPVPGFNVPTIDGPVRDLRLVGNRLWLAGSFTVVGRQQRALATINAQTGAADTFMSLAITGTHNGGYTLVRKIDVTPDGRRLFAIGNFTHVDGVANRQIVALDIDGATAQLSGWRTEWYSATCSSSFDSYMRDLDISPDGEYVVITTTGAYSGGPPKPCDTYARFEVDASGTNIQPTWVNYTGGDTNYAVAVTGAAVYVGGHFRWSNNPIPSRGDSPGPGAVAREGIAAVDPANGLPLTWNPGRTKGVGVFDILATPTGIWVASDTDRIGNFEFHGRIAFFPLAGGTPLPANRTAELPAAAYLIDPPAGGVVGRWFDGQQATADTAIPEAGTAWGDVRAAVMIDETVYFARNDGAFVGRSFDGHTFGDPVPQDTGDQLVFDSAWHNDVRAMTGMFYDQGRLYYTVSGRTSLSYRYFTPENRVVGAYRFTASGNLNGLDWRNVRGMFLGGGHLHWTTASGELWRVDWQDGAPVAGTIERIGGPAVDGVDWRARAVFLSTLPFDGVNQEPVAELDVECDGLECTATAERSADPDGEVVEASFDFGDGSDPVTSAPAEPVTHTYEEPGTYEVTLTVTDDDGATATTTTTVEVEEAEDPDPPSGDVVYVAGASSSANALNHQVVVPADVQAGDALLLFASVNNTNSSLSEPSGGAGWQLLDTAQTSSMRTAVWWARADASTAGSTVRLTTSAFSKVNVSVVAYRNAALPPAVHAKATESTSVVAHRTPQVAVPAGGGLVVSYWAHKDSASTSLTASGVVSREFVAGTSSGRVLSLVADSGELVPAGSYGGMLAAAQSPSAQATMWSIVLR